MRELPESLFTNPVWHALHTGHRRFAETAGEACRYPRDVAPFAAVRSPSDGAMQQLRSLLEPGESIWLIGGGYPQGPGLVFQDTMECVQMVLSDAVARPAAVAEIASLTAAIARPVSGIEVAPLAAADANDMVALTTLAFPGFFRSRTGEMGSYLGVRSDGELVAMGGERLQIEGYREVSGVCTHPAHRGKGLAARIIGQLAQNHRAGGLTSWLQVAAANTRAIDLYRRLGFEPVRGIMLRRVARV